MLPLQPRDYPELSRQQEAAMALDLAEKFNDYICEELIEKLSDLAADVLEDNNIDPQSSEGIDLQLDLIKRISVVANLFN